MRMFFSGVAGKYLFFAQIWRFLRMDICFFFLGQVYDSSRGLLRDACIKGRQHDHRNRIRPRHQWRLTRV